MRTYPTLTEQPTSRDFIEAFGGYNHNIRIGENEFYDMKNLTSTNYPVLSTREKRGTYIATDYFKKNEVPVALIEKDGLCVVTVTDNGQEAVWAGFDRYTISIKRDGEPLAAIGTSYGVKEPRQVVSMGAYIVVFPDGKYVNSIDKNDKGSLGAYYTSEYNNGDNSYNVKIDLCKADGTSYAPNYISQTKPTGTIANGSIWLDTSSKPSSLKVYSSANGMWSSVMTTYARIGCQGIGKNFEVGDAVRISGITGEEWGDLDYFSEKKACIIQAKGDDYIVVIGILNADETYNSDGTSQMNPIEIRRVVPIMDYVFECNNRIWGCRYGTNYDGEIVNEIYACKQGDFKNWESFPNTSKDSYQLSLGADGEFTGAISYMGTPLFFKQDRIFAIYGGYPTQYQLQTTECQSVQAGGNSLAVVDGVLYYKSINGVCAYTGSMPTEIGTALGDVLYRYRAVSCAAYKHKYYLQLIDSQDKANYVLFVYDTEKGMWHKEDKFDGMYLCSVTNRKDAEELFGTEALYYVQNMGWNTPTASILYAIKMIEGIYGYTDDEEIEWFAETGVIGCSSPDKKYISRISFRLSMEVGQRIYVFAEYDSSGTWEQIGAITGSSLSTFTFPVRPKRCDHLRLRIVGTGSAKIYSISKTLEQGSDI